MVVLILAKMIIRIKSTQLCLRALLTRHAVSTLSPFSLISVKAIFRPEGQAQPPVAVGQDRCARHR
jgi:hypothetical protein